MPQSLEKMRGHKEALPYIKLAVAVGVLGALLDLATPSPSWLNHLIILYGVATAGSNTFLYFFGQNPDQSK